VKTPKFAARSELVRYVSEVNRNRSNRPAVATFLPDPPSANPENDHLSVNSIEVESIERIATYHRSKWQGNNGEVALCVHKVFDYSDAGKKCGVQVSYDWASAKWKFRADAKNVEDAYKHRPVLGSHILLNSPSHCGVEFTRALKEHAAGRFARRLSGKGRFHLF